MLTIKQAAARLSVKPDHLEDAGEKHGLPWARSKSGVEYVWVDDVLHVLSKPLTDSERERGVGPQYAGLAIPRWIPPEEAPESSPDEGVSTAVETSDAPSEGDGGPTAGAPPEPLDSPPPAVDLDSYTKDQLIEHAVGLGLEVPSGATKADLRALIDEAGKGSDGDQN